MVRLIQVYSPEHEAVFLFDMSRLTLETLVELGLFRGRKFVAHNGAFEHMMLHAHEHGIVLIDSMQLAGLTLGCEFGARTLASVAEQILGVELPKEQRLSDWGAEVLSNRQVHYAAADAVVCHRAARRMYATLSREERRCFEVQNAAIPAIARMRLTGCPFDPTIHRETIRRWEARARREPRCLQAAHRRRAASPRQGRRLARGAPAGRRNCVDAAHRQRHGVGAL